MAVNEVLGKIDKVAPILLKLSCYYNKFFVEHRMTESQNLSNGRFSDVDVYCDEVWWGVDVNNKRFCEDQ